MMKSILLAAAFTSALPAQAQPVVPAALLSPEARAASVVVDAFHAALKRGDTRAAAALLADDALVFEGGGVERGKAEYASHHLPADAVFAKAVTSSVKHRTGRVEGGIAWIASESTTIGTYKAKPINSAGTETMVLRRDPAGWRIVHIHWSSKNLK
jgi:ketosteroid isomerase-like protein